MVTRSGNGPVSVSAGWATTINSILPMGVSQIGSSSAGLMSVVKILTLGKPASMSSL